MIPAAVDHPSEYACDPAHNAKISLDEDGDPCTITWEILRLASDLMVDILGLHARDAPIKA